MTMSHLLLVFCKINVDKSASGRCGNKLATTANIHIWVYRRLLDVQLHLTYVRAVIGKSLFVGG